jgi:hypothetical protein
MDNLEEEVDIFLVQAQEKGDLGWQRMKLSRIYGRSAYVVSEQEGVPLRGSPLEFLG